MYVWTAKKYQYPHTPNSHAMRLSTDMHDSLHPIYYQHTHTTHNASKLNLLMANGHTHFPAFSPISDGLG